MIRHRTIGLLYTRTCPLQCRHCIIESSPKATGKMEKAAAADYLRTIARYSDQVCFTGGEPMLYYTEIVELVALAVELGLTVSMVSGAGWVRTDKAHIARERVAALREAGLTSLCISWDQYHEEFSPCENAELLASLAVEHGLQLIVRGVAPATQPRPYPTTAFGRFPAEFRGLVKLGSATRLPQEQFVRLSTMPAGSCDVVLSPVIEPDGNVYACCGPSRFSHASSPLILGNVYDESLDTILDRGARDPILKALLLVGPLGLHNLLKGTPIYKEVFRQRSHYSSICDLCLDLTDVPAIVTALRARLTESDGRAMLMAAEMAHRAREAARTAFPVPAAAERSEAHHVA